MSNITDGFKDVFLAGIGAMALTAEKSKELVDQLIAKGEITIDQGKQLNAELKHQAVEATSNLRDDVISVRMASMSKEEREAFAARVAELAALANEKDAARAEAVAQVEVEAVVAEAVEAAPEAAEAPEAAPETAQAAEAPEAAE